MKIRRLSPAERDQVKARYRAGLAAGQTKGAALADALEIIPIERRPRILPSVTWLRALTPVPAGAPTVASPATAPPRRDGRQGPRGPYGPRKPAAVAAPPMSAPPSAPGPSKIVIEVNGDRVSLANLAILAQELREVGRKIFGPASAGAANPAVAPPLLLHGNGGRRALRALPAPSDPPDSSSPSDADLLARIKAVNAQIKKLRDEDGSPTEIELLEIDVEGLWAQRRQIQAGKIE